MKRRNGALYVILVISLSMTIAGVSYARVRGQQANQVGLVVDFGNGTVYTHCVQFDQPDISGYDVLRQSGLQIVADEVSGMGVTICDIGGVSGCSASDCFCRCQGMTCTYWSYYHLEGEGWRYSPMGASAHAVRHGDVEGWAWGEGSLGGGGAQPPVTLFEQICSTSGGPATAEPPASPTDAPTLAPTPTTLASSTPPSPSPVATVMPSSTTSQTVDTTLILSPTLEATKSSSPTPTGEPATSPPLPTTVPLASPTLSEPSSPSPSVTRTKSAHLQPAATSVQVAEVDSLEEGPVNEEQVTPPTEDDSPSPLPPIGYIVFILMVCGLLGWLIFILRSRGERA